jgi:2-keto-4-pentenoate hydratase/2-oxohepta-3-ene-1,7-dioic acid hydratase in catechol pathway
MTGRRTPPAFTPPPDLARQSTPCGSGRFRNAWCSFGSTPPQFSLAKSFARFGPTGPVAVTTDELADRDDIGFECWLNNERVQRGRTSEMIFPVDDLVARISRVCRLLPGDLIFTCTPAGVGNRRNPPRYLAEGDVLVSRFEGIGEIRQSFAR